MFDNQGINKFSALDTPKTPETNFAGAVQRIQTKRFNEQSLTSVAWIRRGKRSWELCF